MLTIYKLLAATGFAGLALAYLNRYLARQTMLGWLGLNHRASGWNRLLGQLDTRFSYRNKDIEKNFIQAGFYNTGLARFYFPAKLLVLLVLESGLLLFGQQLGIEGLLQGVIIGLLLLIVVIILPPKSCKGTRNNGCNIR